MNCIVGQNGPPIYLFYVPHETLYPVFDKSWPHQEDRILALRKLDRMLLSELPVHTYIGYDLSNHSDSVGYINITPNHLNLKTSLISKRNYHPTILTPVPKALMNTEMMLRMVTYSGYPPQKISPPPPIEVRWIRLIFLCQL